MRRIISAIALWLPVTLLAGGTLTFPFSAEEAGSWKRTGGTDCNVESGVLIVDGTHWDSKVYRTVELLPGASYELSAVGRGKTVVKLMENWQKTWFSCRFPEPVFMRLRFLFERPRLPEN